ncbi:MAG: hypothetical protein Q8N46_05065 [Anaerolineales bacterium]|nr:hypothetical protein [Anaerolineales bacterium]
MANDDDENELEPKLFATDRRGYKVFCNELQLDEIYEHHKELMNFWANEKDMMLAIAEASEIYQSIHGSEFHVYYRSKKNKNTELKVIAKFDKNNMGTLWMAQPSTVGQRNNGEEKIWVAENH